MKAKDIIKEMRECGLAPVVVLDDAADAVPLAKALVAGGVWIMEITLRTDAALNAIAQVAKDVPEIIVGAGTVINEELAQMAITAGAKFLVSPGFSQQVANIAQQNDLAYVPGASTMTEIMYAINNNYDLIKIFPAEKLGGLDYIKEIHSVFPKLKFMPSGGVNKTNFKEYLTADYIGAVSGSWLCPKKLIAEKQFDQITEICAQSVQDLQGFELLHIGINNKDEAEALATARQLGKLLNLPVSDKGTAYFVGDMADVIKYELPCKHGHIAIQVNDMDRAIRYFKDKGYTFTDIGKGVDDNGNIVALWFDPKQVDINGFAVHLRRR